MTIFAAPILDFEFAFGADPTQTSTSWRWTDYTDRLAEQTKVTITRGRGDRYAQVPPARLSAYMYTTDGLLVPDNPMGTLYGTLTLNTPVRVLVRPQANLQADTFTRTAASSWGTADTGGAWTNSGTAADYSVSATFGRHTNTAATSPHYSTLAASILRTDTVVRIRVNALSTGAAQSAGIVARFADTSNANRAELRFNTSGAIDIRLVSRSAGADTTVTTVTTALTHSTSSWYRLRLQSGVSPGGTVYRAKAWLDGTTEPRTWDVDGSTPTISVNTTAGKSGLYSMRETGNTNANATFDFDDWSLVDGPRAQFTGSLDQLPTQWTDASGNQAVMRISAAGVLQRIQQNSQQPSRSALFLGSTDNTYYSATDTTVAYWSLEDGQVSTSFASGLPGGAAMIASGWTPSAAGDALGSGSLPVANANGASLSSVVRAYTSPSPNQWSVRWLTKMPTAPTTTDRIFAWTSAGTITEWRVIITAGSPDVVKLQGLSGSTPTDILAASGASFTDTITGAELYNRYLYFEVTATQNGASIDWTMTVWYDTGGFGHGAADLGSVAGTLGNVARPWHAGYPELTAGGYTIGHVLVTKEAAPGMTSDAVTGFRGESTASRFARVCAQQGIVSFFGDLLAAANGSSSTTMGTQSAGNLLAQLREVEATEEGILHDGKWGHLQLLSADKRGARAVAFTLDKNAHQLGFPFEPQYDYFLFRNDVTAQAPSGSSARAVATGNLSPANVQPYPDQIFPNPAAESLLTQRANWRLVQGQLSVRRYPQLPLSLTRNPDLIDEWVGTDVGYRFQVTNPPSILDPTPIDLLVEGYTEVIGQNSYEVTINASTAEVWDTFIVADTTLGLADTHDTRLLMPVASGATSMLFAVGPTPSGKSDAPGWSTTNEPYDVKAAGERIRVTSMAAAAPAFVAAGAAAHADNASLVPALPAGIQSGDLLLVLCAIRNTAAFAGAVSGGWTALGLAGNNVAILGKYWDGVFTAPTVSFSGGAAGDTTSAQIAAFRGVQLELTAPAATQSNGSAQNIATPAVEARRQRALFVVAGWKQDDWTSVATLPGGFAEIGEPSSTLGNDQGLVWDYLIATGTGTAIATNTATVTGGVNAVSSAISLALPTDVQVATVTRSVNGVTKAQVADEPISLWRPGRLAP